MAERLTVEERRVLMNTIREVDEKAWAIAVGLVLALGLFVATNVLVLKAGSDVGFHLRLLRLYFPGYTVTFVGSLVGFVYAFVLGYGITRTVVTLYNRLTVWMR
jgi:hypothetical protein